MSDDIESDKSLMAKKRSQPKIVVTTEGMRSLADFASEIKAVEEATQRQLQQRSDLIKAFNASAKIKAKGVKDLSYGTTPRQHLTEDMCNSPTMPVMSKKRSNPGENFGHGPLPPKLSTLKSIDMNIMNTKQGIHQDLPLWQSGDLPDVITPRIRSRQPTYQQGPANANTTSAAGQPIQEQKVVHPFSRGRPSLAINTSGQKISLASLASVNQLEKYSRDYSNEPSTSAHRDNNQKRSVGFSQMASARPAGALSTQASPKAVEMNSTDQSGSNRCMEKSKPNSYYLSEAFLLKTTISGRTTNSTRQLSPRTLALMQLKKEKEVEKKKSRFLEYQKGFSITKKSIQKTAAKKLAKTIDPEEFRSEMKSVNHDLTVEKDNLLEMKILLSKGCKSTDTRMKNLQIIMARLSRSDRKNKPNRPTLLPIAPPLAPIAHQDYSPIEGSSQAARHFLFPPYDHSRNKSNASSNEDPHQSNSNLRKFLTSPSQNLKTTMSTGKLLDSSSLLRVHTNHV